MKIMEVPVPDVFGNIIIAFGGLLAVGVRSVEGNFTKGDFVNIADEKGEVFAFGIVNYSSKKLLPLSDLRDKIQIKEKYKKEIVHIDNLTLLK